MSDLIRQAIDAIVPKGSAWRVELDGDLDNLYQAIAENWEEVRVFISGLARIRNPRFTVFLEDLEREFGVLTDLGLTEAERREYLRPIVFNQGSSGDLDGLQNALDLAGFNVQVHANDPAVNPNFFMGTAIQCGVAEAVCGNDIAVCGGTTSYELLANGDLFKQRFVYTITCGQTEAVCGNSGAVCGAHSDLVRDPVIFNVPTDSGDWPLIFFIGGDATRDGVTNELIDIQVATVPIEKKNKFRSLILKYKPIHSWAGLIIDYI